MLCHIAFYRFVALPDADAVVDRVRELTRDLTGNVLVAEEGINGALAGPAEALDRFQRDLAADDRFAGMGFRRTPCDLAPFARIKVHRRPEIVAVGEAGGLAPAGRALDPHAWRALLQDPDVVVLDNRNAFEYRVGHFRGAQDPGVRHFRDFPAYVEAHAPRWRAEGRRVAMYCTGGIRCDKTSGWMSALGLDVLRLEGGILNYFQTLPDAAREWDGACFVFDNRLALDTRGQAAGLTPEAVYGDDPDDAWRLARARRLDAAG